MCTFFVAFFAILHSDVNGNSTIQKLKLTTEKFIDGFAGSGGELSGPKAEDQIGGSPYSPGGGFRYSATGEDGWNDAYRDDKSWYKTEKAILVTLIISIVLCALGLGVGLGVGLGTKNQLGDQARLSSMSSASLASVSSQAAMNASLGIYTSIGYLTSTEVVPGAPGQVATPANGRSSATAFTPGSIASNAPAPASTVLIVNLPATLNQTNAAFTIQTTPRIPELTQSNVLATNSLELAPTAIPVTSNQGEFCFVLIFLSLSHYNIHLPFSFSTLFHFVYSDNTSKLNYHITSECSDATFSDLKFSVDNFFSNLKFSVDNLFTPECSNIGTTHLFNNNSHHLE